MVLLFLENNLANNNIPARSSIGHLTLSPLRNLLLPTTQERIRYDTTVITSPFTWADLDEIVRSYYGHLDIQPNFS
ncbi:hypothetical protein RhiirC2_799597 [Rhizophagus irregularis]|uniref:Uncharacterized protein n=1 Tax=Rhizophagus irregularis TaxID=588596 RepID=A0A2N1M4T4_9GLOM|nr:hypothetical protein RhiirC2_799597 [Rhizophagus irregularis]